MAVGKAVIHVRPPHVIGGKGTQKAETSRRLSDDRTTPTTGVIVVVALFFCLISAFLEHLICERKKRGKKTRVCL